MNVICVCSFKGGTAKTSTALHLGAGLAHFHKKRVLLIDFDAQANLTTGLGFDPDENESMAPVLQGTKSIEEVIIPSSIPLLDLIPADTWLERVEVSGNLAADRYSHEKLRNIIAPLSYDFVLIDTPPSLCWLTESALIASHFALICATPEFYSVKGLQRLSLFLETIRERHGTEVLGVLLSFWNERGKSNPEFLQLAESIFPGKTLPVKIRRDIAVSEATIYGKPIFLSSPKSRASIDYQTLTEEIVERISHVEVS